MRKKPLNWVEECRLTKGPMGSTADLGMNGAFYIPCPDGSGTLVCVCSDQNGWDHLSAHVDTNDAPHGIRLQRCPTWEEMVYLKRTFWNHDECVVEYHPPEGNKRNLHNYTLHLWRPQHETIPMPPMHMV